MDIITAANVHRIVGRDSRGLKHVIFLPQPNRNGDVIPRSRCGAETWDTIDMIEGIPSCVRCLSITR
jgi:hypothetical protein